MIGAPSLTGRDRYERVTEGRVDNTDGDAFIHTVRVTDDDHAAEVRALCTPSPEYEVREATAWIDARHGGRDAVKTFAALAGTRMVAGFTRRLTEVCGAGPSAHLVVDAGIEVARLARQVAKLPIDTISGLTLRDAATCWNLDTTAWHDLPDSCFTYSDAGRERLSTQPVTTPMIPDLYSPAPGAANVFARKRLTRLVLTGSRLHLFNSLHDNVHGFDVHYEIDLDRACIAAADSVTSRLPYEGICNEPQRRLHSMVGQPVDAGLRKRIQTLLGGRAGCAQLYDLTADLLRLITVD